jgi:N-acetyl-gamma-glutamyl-phosphate reductase
MVVSEPMHTRLLNGRPHIRAVHELFSRHYQGSMLIKVLPHGSEDGLGGFLPANGLADRDDMEILISGDDSRLLLAARFDNLGKGASGAAVQCMNLMLGIGEFVSLNY